MKNLVYLTYQSFPSTQANSLQSITNIKYIVKEGVAVKLIFPLREKSSKGDISSLQNHYDFKESFEVIGTKHYLPFGKIKFGEKVWFLISHFLWSFFISSKTEKYSDNFTVYFTRSEWIFYFLSLKNKKVVYECHQLSFLKKILIPKCIKKDNSKIIFLNDHLRNNLNFSDDNLNKTIVAHNGVDPELFKDSRSKRKNNLIFVGNLERFNQERNLDFLINGFKDSILHKKYKLKIIGGPSKEAERLRDKVKNLKLENCIEVLGRLSQKQTVSYIQESDIGILINSSINEHSVKFTSPLKYFEYLYGGCKVLAVDFPSHRSLPYSNKINFFTENDNLSFINGIVNFENNKKLNKSELNTITTSFRAKNIVNFIF
tara:strand:+ start:1244 stop:2362 length:1119 start_codon:yes stop_codon:yes gene_type:complete